MMVYQNSTPGSLENELAVEALEMRLEFGFFDFVSDVGRWVSDRVRDVSRFFKKPAGRTIWNITKVVAPIVLSLFGIKIG